MKQLTIESIPEIEKYLNKYQYLSANYNLITIFLWSVAFPTYYLIEEDVLYLFEQDHGIYHALMPVTSDENIEKSLKNLAKILQQLNQPFLLNWVPERQAQLAAQLGYKIVLMEDYQEYIHLSSSFRTLSGKKLQKKRNNYNYFIKNYQYQFRQLTKTDFPAIYDLLDQWLQGKEEINHFIAGELKGIARLLDLYQILDYKIAGVFIDNQLKAFSIISKLNDNYVEVNIEKADPSIRGLYTFLAVSMQKHFYLEAEYINREDDAGNEKLRKSKMSYYPCAFLRVYQITS